MNLVNLKFEKKNRIGIITINRPPSNSISRITLFDFNSVLNEIENDIEIRVVVITGSGDKSFSAGFDLDEANRADKVGKIGSEIWTRIDRFPKPVIAAINGLAIGGGCELALACHFRIMSNAPCIKIGLTELNLGIIPGWGGTQRLTRIIGKAKALDMIIFSKRISGVKALDIGLVNQLADKDKVLDEALKFAGKIAKRPPIAVSAVLKAITAGLDYGMDEGLKVEQEGVELTRNSLDCNEGLSAYLERRRPVFTGE